MHGARHVAFAVTLLALGCGHTPPATTPPSLNRPAPEESAESEDTPPPLWREGTPGVIVLFVRNVLSRELQRTAEKLANDFVEHCDPPYDAIAVVEPGIAAAFPGIRQLANQELAERRRWRAECLRSRGSTREVAEEDSQAQVGLVIDENYALRNEVLGRADPGGDIVVAAYGPHGEGLYRAAVDGDADVDARAAVVKAAIDAVRAAYAH
jgi:hypothetical protein